MEPEDPSDQLPQEVASLENLTVVTPSMEPQYEFTFNREQAFGEIYGQVQFGTSPYLRSAVDAQGRVIIPNESEKYINVYDSSGTKITTLGREGRGPGEFTSLYHMGIIGDEIYATFASGIGINFFSLDSLVSTHTLYLEPELENIIRDSATWLIQSPRFYRTVDGKSLLAAYRDYDKKETPQDHRLKFYLLNREGRFSSDLLLEMRSDEKFTLDMGGNFPGRGILTDLPVSLKSLIDVDSNALIYYARTDTPLVKVRDTTGTYRKAFYLDLPRVETRADDVISLADNGDFLAGGIRKMDLRPLWPAFDSMIIDDDDRIWISTVIEDFEVYRWWVLDTEGNLLARFDWPRDKPIRYIRDDHIYTRETNEERYIDEIVRYRIIQ
ncbi:MAG: hypothetical protein U5K31_11200 [Balneolaceae bacterium]|nr:hypothetical protein [Balneolaceae bacterium]